MFERWRRRQPKTIGLVPIGDIAELAEECLGSLEWQSNGFVCRSGEIATHVQVDDVTTATREGLETVSVLTVETGLPSRLPRLSLEQVTMINMVAVVDALLLNEKSGQLSFNSRLTVYPGDEAAWTLYRKFAIASACTQRTLLPAVMAAGAAPSPTPAHEASPWTAEDFQTALRVFRSRGWFTNGDECGITTEFPWDVGATTATFGRGRTALLEMRTKEVHPHSGSGLFVKLELPITFNEGAAAAVANRLNWSEFRAIDAVPFWGAWFERMSARRVAFVCFVPNTLYHRGLVMNLSSWMAGRTAQAKATLATMGFR